MYVYAFLGKYRCFIILLNNDLCYHAYFLADKCAENFIIIMK